jgi:hypothetical protein
MWAIVMEIEVPASLGEFHLPEGVHRRLQDLLDRQDSGQPLTEAERLEAEGLVDLAEWLSLLRLQAQRLSREAAA